MNERSLTPDAAETDVPVICVLSAHNWTAVLATFTLALKRDVV